MCVGGGAPASGILNLVACAKCLAITTQTKPNETRLHGLAYWYMSPQLSFGFSHLSQISLIQADINTDEGYLRLSWHLNLSSGGWRLGNVTTLNNEDKLYKKIFLKGKIHPLAPNKLVNVIKTKSKGVVTKAKSKVATTKSNGKLVTTKPKGKLVTTKPKGKIVTTKPKGKLETTKPKGKLVTTKPKGKLVTTKPKAKLTTTLSDN